MDQERCRERILSEEYWDFILSVDRSDNVLASDEEACVQQAGAGFEIAYQSRTQAEPIDFERYVYNSVPLCYTLLDMDAMNQTGISQVQYYPTLDLSGEGIMIGFLDSGIDYKNEVFRKLDGSSRIVGIWDQTIQSGTPPQGLAYGSVYTESKINEALRQEVPERLVPSLDASGHGTFVASIACGSANAENQFLGAAPEAQIGVVKLKPAKSYLREFYGIPAEAICYQENDIMLGIRYLRNLAKERDMPLVICMALGTSFGDHNGNGALDLMLRLYSNSENLVLVTGTGNEANQRHHYRGEWANLDDRREVEIQVGADVSAFSLELWTELPNLAALSVISPSGEILPARSVRQSGTYSFRFLFERTHLQVYHQIISKFNSAQLIFLRFTDPAPGIWRVIVEPIRLSGGVFHMWLPMKEFLSGTVIFLESDPDTTLTGPSSVSSVISTGHYNGDENSIDINSGRGYTRLENVKPDFTAPGVGVIGALPGGRFAERSGSSVATGITAGACALLMQWLQQQRESTVLYDTLQLKGLLILGVRKRPDITYPDRSWGYGMLDLYGTLQTIREL